MSEHELRRYWCLIDGNTRPFTVLASPNYDIDELTGATQKEIRVLCDVDASDLVPNRKVNF